MLSQGGKEVSFLPLGQVRYPGEVSVIPRSTIVDNQHHDTPWGTLMICNTREISLTTCAQMDTPGVRDQRVWGGPFLWFLFLVGVTWPLE